MCECIGGKYGQNTAAVEELLDRAAALSDVEWELLDAAVSPAIGSCVWGTAYVNAVTRRRGVHPCLLAVAQQARARVAEVAALSFRSAGRSPRDILCAERALQATQMAVGALIVEQAGFTRRYTEFDHAALVAPWQAFVEGDLRARAFCTAALGSVHTDKAKAVWRAVDAAFGD